MRPICIHQSLNLSRRASNQSRACSLPIFWLLGLVLWALPAAGLAQGSVAPLPVAPGAEALGRGGAFAAKADSPLALEYNVAGLAQLRGTQVLVDGQLFLPNEGTPCIDYYQRDRQRPCYGGLVAASTDFGVLRRWTFAVGLRLPALVTGYGLYLPTVQDPGGGALLWPRALLLSPSVAVAVQAHPRLAVGLLLEDAMGLVLIPCPTTTGALAAADCPRSRVAEQSLLNPVVQLGLLGNLGSATSQVLLAASLRSAPNLGREPIFAAPRLVSLPWTARAGVRYLRRRATGQPVADVELDGVAQLWMPDHIDAGQGQSRSSLGLRLGASYHVQLQHAVVVGRLGLLFDGWLGQPTTDSDYAAFGAPVEYAADARQVYVLGGTFGVGVQTRYLDVDLGYGYQSQLTRLPAGAADPLGLQRPAGSHLLSLSLLLRLGAAAGVGRAKDRPGSYIRPGMTDG